MKKMPSRRDDEEDVISGRLIFRTFQMHVSQIKVSQIKVEDKSLI